MKKNSLLFLLFAFGKLAIAQTAVINTGILYISGSSDIFCAGSNFTNTSASALTNNGQLHVKGHLVNDQASMATGTGTLFLDGTSAQIVAGAQTFKTYDLNTNNSTGITLNSNLSVSGTHTFTNGVIATSATPNYLVYEAGSSYSGDGDSKHVNGWVKKFGSTNFIFPVGNGTVERTIALNSLSVSSEFNVKHNTSTPNVFSVQSPIINVDNAEYWSILKVSGGSASVAMNWNYAKIYFPNYVIADIRVAGYNGSLWTNNGGTASGNATTTGTITSNSISSFNLFTFGSITYVLPLSVISFNASRVDNYTAITWTTEREANTDHFEVERSDDGVSFYRISQVTARNSGFTEQYSTRDNAPVKRIAYYRLRSIDGEGKSTLSRVMSVRVADGNDLLTLVANPVHDKITLAASNQLNGVFNYSIHAINGQLLQDGKLIIQNGGQYTLAITKVVEPGTYTLDVSNGVQRFRYKLMIQ